MPTTITLLQMRTALCLLQANISAEALYAALKPARVQTPDKARTLAHYETEAAIARAMLAEPAGFCGPMQLVKFESAEMCVTGSRFGQPLGLLKDNFYGVECGALDAPSLVPCGSVRTVSGQQGNVVFAMSSDYRPSDYRMAHA